MTGHPGASIVPQPQDPPRWARACLARVPVADVARDPAAVLAEAFAASELDDLAGRPARSVAGRLALKRALIDLWAFLVPGLPVSPRDFLLGRDARGAPVLRGAPGVDSVAGIRVSIAHSPDLAVGLAACLVPGGPP